MEFIENKVVVIAITFLVYWSAKRLQARTGWLFLNPILVSMIAIIALLKASGMPYEKYAEGANAIDFWLKPAIVALAVPLYLQLTTIRKQLMPIIISQLAGCVVGVVSVVLVAKWMGASDAVIISLAPKSVTTPIAMEVTGQLGGIPSLTAAIVICVGLFGAIFGVRILQVGRVKSPIARGISLGTAAHAIGTSRASEFGHIYGAYASLGLILNGVLTALLAPLILKWMGVI